jgi:hypothetical protein
MNEPEIDEIREEVDNRINEARDALVRALSGRIRMSVARRTPYLSDQATKELTEDVIENVTAYLKDVFTL